MSVLIRGTHAVAIALLASLAHAAPPELRGTWLTTTANDAIATPVRTDATMRRLREIGLNTVYVECWKNGYTEYPSPTLKATIGVAIKVNGKDAPQRDLLAETALAAHRNGLLCVAWFEYGFIAAHKDTRNELRAKADWLTQTRDGKPAKGDAFVWLNPFRPDVQQFLIDVALDAVRTHDLDGVQFDDHTALPVELGYDAFTRELYKRETGREVPNDFKEERWMRWRADKLNAFSLRLVTALREAGPTLILSTSPAPYPWSYDHFLSDWKSWTEWCACGGRRWDEYVPQNYRMNAEATTRSVAEQVAFMDDGRDQLAAGLRVVGDGPDLSWPDLKWSIEFTREQKLSGHVLWFSRGVLDVYPTQLAAFYDVAKLGPAAHPRVPANWRPMPVVATRDRSAWRATVNTPGRYRVIARDGDVWREVRSVELKAGDQPIDAGDAAAVELIVDRRDPT